MSDSVPKPVEASDFPALTKVARIELSAERQAAVAPAFDGILQLFDTLDAVELGETPPTNSFDARWRGQS